MNATQSQIEDFLKRVAQAAPRIPSEKNWLDNDIMLRDLARQARLLIGGSLDSDAEEKYQKKLANLAKGRAARTAQQSARSQSNSNADAPHRGERP